MGRGKEGDEMGFFLSRIFFSARIFIFISMFSFFFIALMLFTTLTHRRGEGGKREEGFGRLGGGEWGIWGKWVGFFFWLVVRVEGGGFI